MRRTELILGMLLPGLFGVDHYAAHKDWVYGDPIDGQITSEFRQLGYTYPKLGDTYEGFTPTEGLSPLQTLPWSEFYARELAIRSNEDLIIPDNLTNSLDRVYAMQDATKEKFLRACYWLHTSRAIHHASKSSSYIALVSAIEALLPPASQRACPECGKPAGPGPTGLFKEFLEKYLPGAVPASLRSKFYSVRSELAHGSGLMTMDEVDWGMSHETAAESTIYRQLTSVARVAVYNWMQHQ